MVDDDDDEGPGELTVGCTVAPATVDGIDDDSSVATGRWRTALPKDDRELPSIADESAAIGVDEKSFDEGRLSTAAVDRTTTISLTMTATATVDRSTRGPRRCSMLLEETEDLENDSDISTR